MAQIIKPASTLNDQTQNLQEVNVNASTRPRNEFIPTKTLKNSVASTAFNGDPQNRFEAVKADIPDNFATNESPKLKFLFTVEFKARDGLTLPEYGAEEMEYMMFALKRATRPQPSIVYQDMNFYGLRQKVGTKMDYGTVTLMFYDDVVNRAHNIVSEYIKSVSPIAGIPKENASSLTGSSGGARTYGALKNKMGPFEWMRVTHHVLDDKNANTGQAKQIYYDYLNPKILSVNLDDLNMTQSDVNNVEIVFVYDSVNISYSDVAEANPNTTDAKNTPITNGIVSGTTSDNTAFNTNLPFFVGNGAAVRRVF